MLRYPAKPKWSPPSAGRPAGMSVLSLYRFVNATQCPTRQTCERPKQGRRYSSHLLKQVRFLHSPTVILHSPTVILRDAPHASSSARNNHLLRGVSLYATGNRPVSAGSDTNARIPRSSAAGTLPCLCPCLR